MKVLFLDMDGVVNSARHFKALSKRSYKKARGIAKAACRRVPRTMVNMIDPEAIPHLNAILKATGAVVVVSSTWRILHSIEAISEALCTHGFEGLIVDKTGRTRPGCRRGHDIQDWLDQHPEVTSFAILDDCSDMEHLMDRLVQTSWENGLQERHVKLVVDLLNPVGGEINDL